MKVKMHLIQISLIVVWSLLALIEAQIKNNKYSGRIRNEFWYRNSLDGDESQSLDSCDTFFNSKVTQLIIDYAKWRNTNKVLLIDKDIRTDCNLRAIQKNLKCFLANGINFGLQTFLRLPHHNNLGSMIAVIFVRKHLIPDQTTKFVSGLSSTFEKLSWLIIVFNVSALSSPEHNFFDSIRNSSLDLDDQLTVAISLPKNEKEEDIYISDCKRRNQRLSVDDLSILKVSADLPFLHKATYSLNVTQYIEDKCEINLTENRGPGHFCLLQMYKLRSSYNTSLVVLPLGKWSYQYGTRDLKPFQTTEKRLNMHNFPLILGKKKESQTFGTKEEHTIEEVNDPKNMERISDYIMTLLNTKEVSRYYLTLGTKQVTGGWNGLLGGVIKQEVDIGLESVIQVPERYADLSFSEPVMDSIRCIYLKPEESHSVRDIFLIPFGTWMSFCMVAMLIMVIIIMTAYLKIVKYIWKRKLLVGESKEARVSDATIWASSVFFMQGSHIIPKTLAAKIIVVCCMLFALVVNTSYQGFLTSILSVKLENIRTVDDLLQTESYDIGYAKDSQDEVFLRTQNNISQLNQIYLRGYLHNNVTNITEGILKATKGNYGFFATGHVARKQILKISSGKCRYNIKEISIPSTRYQVALPMSKSSPYKKLLNYGIIKMYESGIHNYITKRIAPQIPACDRERLYSSARINDLTTAFIILALGIIAGVATFIAEKVWSNRKGIWRYIRNQNRNRSRKRQINQNQRF